MLHHGDHPFASQFRSDAANVGLAFLEVLKSHVDRPFPHHVLNFQIKTRQQRPNHHPEILSRKGNGNVTLQLLSVRGEQLFLDLLGLTAVEIPNRGHDEDVEVTGFESSSALHSCFVFTMQS